MNINKYLKISFGAAVLLATQVSCIHDDNWDAPQIVCNNKFDAPTKTLAQVVAMAPASGKYVIPNKQDSEPIIFDGYVVSSDEQGNFYKTISFQDAPENPTVGLQIEINNSMNYTDFPVGAHIRIKANGLVIARDAGVVKLGAVDPNYNVGRIPASAMGRYMSGVCDGNGLEIKTIVPTEVTLANVKQDKYLNTLVKIKDVQFDDAAILAGRLMDKDSNGAFVDTDRKIVDANNQNSTAIRTDGYFKESAYVIPNKSGNVTVVASRYNTTTQLIIRSTKDLELTKELPPKPVAIINETFNDFTTNGWTTYSVTGSPVWSIATFGNPKPSALMNGLNSANEDWLISKEIDLSGGYISASFSFESDGRYSPGSTVIEVYATTDTYADGAAPSTVANWKKLDAKFDDDLNAFAGFVTSGEIDLTTYVGKKIRIAFKYTNATSAATSWEIDNFIVKGMKK